MKISDVSINRPIFASMMIGAFVVFGLVAARTIGVSLFPDVDMPVVTVTVLYEGADPETVETEVTDRIEEAVNTIAGIKSLRSESTEGLAQIFIEFEMEVDVDVASQDVRDKVASIRSSLPGDIEAPVVEKFDPDSSPILSIVVSGPVSIRELTRYADGEVKPRIEGVGGVGSVRIVGGRDREIRVWLRVHDLRGYDLTAQDVIDALSRENVEFPGGRIETRDRELVIKTKGEVRRVAQFGELVVATRNGNPIRVKDVAYVEDGMEAFRSLSRLNGQRAVSLLVRRQSGTNLVAVAEGVKEELAELEAVLPAGHDLVLAQDLSVFVQASLSDAQGELLRGGILAVLVILLFLRSWRGSVVAAITIPTTIVATYAFMLTMGFTLNMVTLLALSISVGMIIDDSIVVLENSYRHMEEGKTRREAALVGISEIGFAVIATSLAIGAVFVPVAFMKGLIGEFFFEFGLTVAFAVAFSTFIALTLTPMLCSRLLKVPTKEHGRLFHALETAFTKLESGYRATLGFALGHRLLILALAIGVFVGSLMLVPLIGQEFVPEEDEAQFNIIVEAPLGSSIRRTGRNVEEIERRLRTLPGVTNIFTTIGGGQEDRVNVATTLVQLVPRAERSRDQSEIMAEARRLLADLSHLEVSVEIVPRVSGGGFSAAPIQYNLRGGDLDQLETLSQEVMDKMRGVPGIVDVNSTYNATKPEVSILPLRDRIADAGVNVQALGRAARALIGGQEVTTFDEAGESFDVRLRLAQDGRNRPDAILALPVRTRDGSTIEFRSLVDVEVGTGPVQIDRQARRRQITIMANLQDGKPLGEALADIQRIEAETDYPEGVTGAITGFGELMEESFGSMLFSLALAVVLIYMVLASQFESLVHPFTIMFSLPLSVGGALGALALTGRTLSIFAMIGMIMLMGLVTKNAILLVDYTNTLRGRGLSKTDALKKACPVRLRPILMTAFSTIAGMTPIALGLGEGAATRAPMGTAVIGGMVTSTLLTLVVIPVMYSLVDSVAVRVRGIFIRTAASPASPTEAEVTP